MSAICHELSLNSAIVEAPGFATAVEANASRSQAQIQAQSFPPYYSTAIATVLLVSAVIICYLLHQDYCRFIALGPGGTPSTWSGFLKIKILSMFAIKNAYMPSPIPPEIYLNRVAYLSKSELPPRKGARPIVSGIAPHRQLDQRPTAGDFSNLEEKVVDMADGWPRRLRHGTSCLEKHGPGLFALQPINQTNHCSGEICHVHPSDKSMHLTLHPADAAVVILRGWGERHPLSSGGWLSRFVPQGFCMVYAPRNEEEVQTVRKIVAAAVWWVAGVDVDQKFG
jgi:hypothetical protein